MQHLEQQIQKLSQQLHLVIKTNQLMLEDLEQRITNLEKNQPCKNCPCQKRTKNSCK